MSFYLFFSSEEQEYLRTQYKERVDLLNERMATKVNTNVLLMETCDKTRDTEREIIKAKAALEELKEKIAQKMSKLEKEQEEYDEKVKVLKHTSQFYSYIVPDPK